MCSWTVRCGVKFVICSRIALIPPLKYVIENAVELIDCMSKEWIPYFPSFQMEYCSLKNMTYYVSNLSFEKIHQWNYRIYINRWGIKDNHLSPSFYKAKIHHYVSKILKEKNEKISLIT